VSAPRVPARCGTYSGYQRHYRNKEKPCDPCIHALNTYQGGWRVRSGHTRYARVPYGLLGALLTKAPVKLRKQAEIQLGNAVVTNAMDTAQAAARTGMVRP
jgi:hypothetical protein